MLIFIPRQKAGFTTVTFQVFCFPSQWETVYAKLNTNSDSLLYEYIRHSLRASECSKSAIGSHILKQQGNF